MYKLFNLSEYLNMNVTFRDVIKDFIEYKQA